jgi:hypothetical protein
MAGTFTPMLSILLSVDKAWAFGAVYCFDSFLITPYFSLYAADASFLLHC